VNILAINPLYFETFWPTNENARGARNEQRCAECANTNNTKKRSPIGIFNHVSFKIN